MVGSQKDITLHAEAIIMYFGLNWKEKSESVLPASPASTDLDTLHWILVVSIENTNLLTVFWVPNVNPAIAGAGDDELGVRRERSLKWKLFRVEMACEGLKGGSVVWVNEFDHLSIGGDQNTFPVWGELQSSPLQFFAVDWLNYLGLVTDIQRGLRTDLEI